MVLIQLLLILVLYKLWRIERILKLRYAPSLSKKPEDSVHQPEVATPPKRKKNEPIELSAEEYRKMMGLD